MDASKSPLSVGNLASQIPAYILDDLCSRFIINLPEEERKDVIRVFFQIELAHWFYLDFYCQDNPKLKACGIKDFSTQVFKHCPTLSDHADKADQIHLSWREYKMAVPTYGAIILDPTYQYVLLVQGYWAKASWGFPKGKVNKEEVAHDCAIREVFEETGFDVAGLLKQEHYIEYKMNEQLCRLYIVAGVSMDTKFQPRTRKEIKKLEWFRVEYLPSNKKDLICKEMYNLNPNAFFMVIPFIRQLHRWIMKTLGHSGGTDSASKKSTRHDHSDRKPARHEVPSNDSKQSTPIARSRRKDSTSESKSQSRKETSERKGTARKDKDGEKRPIEVEATVSDKQRSKQQMEFAQEMQSNFKLLTDGEVTKSGASDNQRSQQQKEFAHDMQKELQNFIKLKDNSVRGRGQVITPGSSSTSSGKHSRRKHRTDSPKSAGKQQIQILNRDGSVSGNTTRRCLGPQFEVELEGKQPVEMAMITTPVQPIDTSRIHSKTWANFHLDTDAFLGALKIHM